MHDEYGSETLMACLGRNETDTGRREEEKRRREENCQISLSICFRLCVSMCVVALLSPFFLSPSLFNSVPL